MRTLNIRVERLIPGDVVLLSGSTWKVRSNEEAPQPTKRNLHLEYIRISGDNRQISPIRTAVERDRMFPVVRLA